MASHFIDQNTIDKAIEFYRSENISRPCPGIRECVRINADGNIEKVQRRLVLLNLQEAY